MLFDLRGKRKRVIQVIYAALALLFAVGFVGFGVGSESGVGGIFDVFSGDGGTGNPQYDEEIEAAEQRLEQDPRNQRALLNLAETHYLAGQAEVETDEETGAPEVTDEARTQFEEGTAAWERYLATKPKRPDDELAALMAQAYAFLEDAEGAAEAQRVVAEASPNQNTYGNLALYLYAAGRIGEGDEAAERAAAEAPKTARRQVERQLAQLSKRAKRLKKQAAQAPQASPEEAFGDPLEQLGGGAGGAPVPPGG